VAVDARNVYVVDGAAGTVIELSKDGRTRTILASGIRTPSSIAVDDTSVYFTAFRGAQVLKTSK
jgi:hypothetical protein